MNKKKNSGKYLQGPNFLQLTLAKKIEFKNLGYAPPGLVISQSWSSRIET